MKKIHISKAIWLLVTWPENVFSEYLNFPDFVIFIIKVIHGFRDSVPNLVVPKTCKNFEQNNPCGKVPGEINI